MSTIKSVVCLLLAISTVAFADMTYSPFLLENGNDSSGNPINNGTFVMVLDLDGDGFDGTEYTAGSGPGGSWLWDGDDMLMDRGPINNGDAFPFRMIFTENIPGTYDAGVDNYYLLWFDVPYDESASGPGDNVAYGVELIDTVGPDPGDYTPFADGGNAILQTGGGGGTNDAPVLDAIADQSVDENSELAFAITASDADGDDLTLSVTGLPAGVFFSEDPKTSPATWTFSWTPAEDESGVYDPVEFTVSDGSLSDNETVAITVDEVNSAPVLDPIGDKTVTAGETLTFDVAATDADIPANVLAFSATNVPAGANFDGTTFNWTPADSQGGNTFDITFAVSDDYTPVAEDSETITVTVDERDNHAPVAEAPQGLVVETGGTLTIPLVAADEDTGDTVTLSIVDTPVSGSLGTIDQATQTVQYTADAAIAGEDHFSFKATDGELDSNVIEVFVLVRSADGWIVNLNLAGADFATLTLGADPEANDDHEDSFDELAPPAGTSSRSVEGNFAGLYRPPFAAPQQYFRRDIRALDGDHTWVLELEVQDGNDPLTVSWNDQELPADTVLALFESDADGNPLDPNDLGTPMAGQADITVTDQDGVVRYCIKAIEDEIEFELTLDAGAWNLISLPISPNNPAVEDVFSDTNLVADGERTLRDGRRGTLHSGNVWDWDEATQSYVAANEIEAYQGYWVYIPEGQGGTITIAGIAATAPTTLHEHWNLVGGDSEPTNEDIALGSIWKWVNSQYAKTTTLEADGLGYWIYAFEENTSLQSNR